MNRLISSRGRRTARRLIPLIAAGASLVAAAPANAGALSVDYGSGTVSYSAAPGESNDFSIYPLSGTYRLQDKNLPSISLTQIAGTLACSILEPFKYRCSSAGLTQASITLGDGTDNFDDSGTPLDTHVETGAGPKTITTGSGNDAIDVRNGAVDHVVCGAGNDTVLADAADVVDATCEVVNRGVDASVTLPGTHDGNGSGGNGPSQSSGSADGTSAGGNLFTTSLGLTMPAATVLMSRPDTAVVPLSCAPTATGGCTGDVVLEDLTSTRAASAAGAEVIAARGHYVAQQRARTRRRLRRARFKLAAGESAKLPVRIAFRGHYALASKRRRARRALLTVVERDARGKLLDTQTRAVTLKLVNKWSRIPRRRHH